MTRIKICGIQTLEEALWAIEAGADALGFVFAPHSKRRITPQDAQKIILKLPPLINKVGVFVNESPEKIAAILQECYLDTIQLHGNEDPKLYHRLPAAKIKVLSFQPTLEVAPPTAFSSSLSQLKELPPHCLQGILLDSTHQGVTGGTGIPLPWQDERFQAYLRQVKSLGYPVILAGGLHPDNVREAIRLTLPYGVDVSSGVEEKGRKDRKKIQNFIGQVRRLRP